MIEMLRKVWAWQERGDWRSWATHSGVAVLYALLLTSLIGWRAACIATVFTFLVREAEQAVHTAFAGLPQHWGDRAMDILAPAIVLGVLSWVFA